MFAANFISYGQITAMFVADDSETPDNSGMIYQLMKGSLPSMDFFNAVDSVRSPSASEMNPYDLVVWYCGSDNEGLYFWDGKDVTNQNLVEYLNNKGNLWLMGSGFLNDRYHTTPQPFGTPMFVWDYLGIKIWFIETYTDDSGTGVPQLDKKAGNPITTLSMDTIKWKNPPEPYVDGCQLTPDCSGVFQLGPSTYVFSGSMAAFYLVADNYKNLTFTFDPATMNTKENMDILFSDVIQFYQELLSGINDHNSPENTKLVIYPNPASSFFRVQTQQKGEIEFRLMDLTGKTIKSKRLVAKKAGGEMEFSVKNLPPGLYFLIADNGKSRLSTKVMISK